MQTTFVPRTAEIAPQYARRIIDLIAKALRPMPIARSVYGLGVEVSLPIAGLLGLREPERIDVRITLGELPEDMHWVTTGPVREHYVSPERDQLGSPNMRVLRIGDRYFRIDYLDGTTIVVDTAGTQVWATWPDPATIEDTATYLLGPTLGFVLRLRGFTCLHGSAIAMGDQAVALVGPSGAGKSTLAAAFAKRGHAVLTDDVVALADEGDRFLVQPAYPRVRLWPESVDGLFGAPNALPRLTPTWEKRYLDLSDPPYRFQDQPLPLAAIYFLDARRENGSGHEVSSVATRDGLMSLVADTYTTYLLDPAMRAREFDILGRLVNAVPMRRLTPDSGLAGLPELCAAIAEDFQRLPPAGVRELSG